MTPLGSIFYPSLSKWYFFFMPGEPPFFHPSIWASFQISFCNSVPAVLSLPTSVPMWSKLNLLRGATTLAACPDRAPVISEPTSATSGAFQ